MPARIDHRLNLVIPVETDNGDVYVFATPLSRTMFERYYLVMARAFALSFQVGGGIVSGPKIAALSLQQAAMDMNVWDGEAGVKNGLVAEVQRLTNVVCKVDGAWEPVPLMDAVASGVLTEDDLAEVEGAVTFFILSCALQQRAMLAKTIDGLTSLWGALSTPLNCMDWIASFLTSTDKKTTSPQPTQEDHLHSGEVPSAKTSSPAY